MIIHNRGLFIKKYDSVNLGIAAVLLYSTVVNYIDGAVGRDGIYQLTQLVYLFFFLNALPSALRKFSIKVVLFLIALFLIYVLSFMVSTNHSVFEEATRVIFLWCIPYFILSVGISDYDDLMKKLQWSSLIIMLFEYLRTFTLSFSTETYSQELGYDALVPFIIFWMSFLREKKLLNLLPIIFSFALMLMSGSRGPLLCAILGVTLSYVLLQSFNKKLFVWIIIAGILFSIFSIYQYELLSWALDVFTGIDVSTRTIEKMLYGELGNDDARDTLRKVATESILRHPFIGLGFLNDRIYIYSHYVMNYTATVYGSYCHNLFLEVMMQFGLIPGLIILVMFFRKLCTRVKRVSSLGERELVILFVTIGLFPLFVSRSWLTFHSFYLLMGIMFARKSILS